jgi:protein TonB
MRNVSLALAILVVSSCTSSNRAVRTDISDKVTPPSVVQKVDPEYPAELRRQGVTGIVTIEGLIDTSGRLLRPQVVRSTDPRLNEFALAAVRMWWFRPATVNGEPAEAHFKVDVSFSAR